MKKIVLMSLVSIALTVNLHALNSQDVVSAGFSDLTITQQAEIISEIAKKKELVSEPSNVQVAQEWVNLGTSIGQGLASSAKELGVAVNEFSSTPVGKLTMFLIIFQVIGAKLIGVFAGILFIALGTIFTTIIMNRFSVFKITYNKEGKISSKERPENLDYSPFWFAYFFIIAIGVMIIGLS